MHSKQHISQIYTQQPSLCSCSPAIFSGFTLAPGAVLRPLVLKVLQLTFTRAAAVSTRGQQLCSSPRRSLHQPLLQRLAQSAQLLQSPAQPCPYLPHLPSQQLQNQSQAHSRSLAAPLTPLPSMSLQQRGTAQTLQTVPLTELQRLLAETATGLAAAGTQTGTQTGMDKPSRTSAGPTAVPEILTPLAAAGITAACQMQGSEISAAPGMAPGPGTTPGMRAAEMTGARTPQAADRPAAALIPQGLRLAPALVPQQMAGTTACASVTGGPA